MVLAGLVTALLACLVLGLCVGTRSVDMVRLVRSLLDHGVAVAPDDR